MELRETDITPDLSLAGEEGAAEPLLLLPEARVGNVEVVRLLGQGVVSESWFGIDTVNQHEVVLKVLRSRWVNDTVARTLFEKTLEGMASLSHPNIARVLHSGFNDGHFYWVTEWVKGGAVGPRIRRKGPMDLATACNAIDQAAAGLAYAQTHAVIHGGLKPENLLMERSGACKIADIGVEFAARRITSIAPGAKDLWQLECMAPEVRNGRHPDARSDIYSLGALLCFMITGVLPDKADAGTRTRVPGAMRDLLAKMLAAKPEDRLADYGQLRAALSDVSALQQDGREVAGVSWLAEANEQAQTQPLDLPPPPQPLPVVHAVPATSPVAAPAQADIAISSPAVVPAADFTSASSPARKASMVSAPTGKVQRLIAPAIAIASAVALFFWFTREPGVAAKSIAEPSAPKVESPAAIPSGTIIVDDLTPGGLELTPPEAWKPSAENRESYENSSKVAAAVGAPKSATFYVDVPTAGKYELHAWWVSRGAGVRSSAIPVTIQTADGPVRLVVDQVSTPSNFNLIGVFELKAGNRQPLVKFSTDQLQADGPNVHLSVDAVKLVRIP